MYKHPFIVSVLFNMGHGKVEDYTVVVWSPEEAYGLAREYQREVNGENTLFSAFEPAPKPDARIVVRELDNELMNVNVN